MQASAVAAHTSHRARGFPESAERSKSAATEQNRLDDGPENQQIIKQCGASLASAERAKNWVSMTYDGGAEPAGVKRTAAVR